MVTAASQRRQYLWRPLNLDTTDPLRLLIWPVDCGEAHLDRRRAYLSVDERANADRFVHEEHRRAFIHARGGCRAILAAETKNDPTALRFVRGPYGKPRLETATHDHALQFNLSHSGGLACLALHPYAQVGVDIEAHRPVEKDLPEHYFSPNERAEIAALPAELWTEAFFNCWTRKEAVIKALGFGLSMPLDAFDVSLAPQACPEIRHIDREYGQASDWRLAAFVPAPQMAGAVVVAGMLPPEMEIIYLEP